MALSGTVPRAALPGGRAGARGHARRRRPDGLRRPPGPRGRPRRGPRAAGRAATGWWSRTGPPGPATPTSRPGGGPYLLAATSRRTATDLLWESLAASSPSVPVRGGARHRRQRVGRRRRAGGPAGAGQRRLPGAARHAAAHAPTCTAATSCDPSWEMGAVTTTDLPLLVLGRGTDPRSERGVDCPGSLPAASDPDLVARARAAKARARRPGVRARPPLPARRGDRVRRRHRRLLQAGPGGRRPAGGGVRRLLRRALHGRVGRHPHLGRPAGDPARTSPPAARWPTWPRSPRSRTPGTRWPTRASRTSVVPVTYMNSSADIKAFCGRNGGAVCTSSNAQVGAGVGVRAEAGREGAVPARPAPRPQHRGAASSASRSSECVVWNPHKPQRRADRRAAARRPDDPVEGALLGARPVLRAVRRRRPRAGARRPGAGAPRVHPRGGHQGRPGRLDRVHHQDRRGGPAPARRGRSAPSSTSCSGSRTRTPSSTSRSWTRPSATARR